MAISQDGYYVYDVPHTYVFRKWVTLTAGVQYIFDTRNLQGNRPDPVMYLVKDNTILACNDDYNVLNALIAYVPPISGQHLLIVRAFNSRSGGTCDVYQKTGNANPVAIASQVKFGGTPIYAKWKADETLETKYATGDTYLYLIDGSKFLYDDDGGDGLCSRIRPGYSGDGTLIIGSYSSNTEGTTTLCNFYKSYFSTTSMFKLPPRPWLVQREFILSDRVLRFQTELKKIKPELETLPIMDVEKRIKNLEEAFLNKEEISEMKAPKQATPKEYDMAFNRYTKLARSKEKALSNLSPAARVTELEKLQIDKNEIFKEISMN